VTRLFVRARQAPIPAPHTKPPGQLSYGDLLVSTFTLLRLPLTWPQFAADLDAAASGDASALETAAGGADADSLDWSDDVGGDLVRRRSRPPAVVGVAPGGRSLH
jgi:hypothetical protein